MKSVIVDYRIGEEEILRLQTLGYNALICPNNKNLYEAVSGHPDMSLYIVDKNLIITAENISNKLKFRFSGCGYNVLECAKEPSGRYPFDISLNGVNLKSYFVHNIKYTDKNVLDNIQNKKIIDVKQGYTKCSTAIVSDDAIITSDIGIGTALKAEGLDVLFLPPGDIELKDFQYGFIGGCSGLLEDGLIAFFGDLSSYVYGHEVLNFLKKHKVEAVYLKKGKLTDRGTLFKL